MDVCLDSHCILTAVLNIAPFGAAAQKIEAKMIFFQIKTSFAMIFLHAHPQVYVRLPPWLFLPSKYNDTLNCQDELLQ